MSNRLRNVMICAFLGALCAGAARGDITWSVEPIRLELRARPGETVTEALLVTCKDAADRTLNAGAPAQTVRFRVYAQDWYLDRRGVPQFRPAGTLSQSCAPWVTINPTEFELRPLEEKLLRISVTVPKEATGEYRMVVFVENVLPPVEKFRPFMQFNGRIGTMVYLGTSEAKRSARIRSFAADGQAAAVTLENLGNVHLRCSGTLEIKDEAGGKITQLEVPAGVILPPSAPESLKEITVDLKDQKLPPGRYVATILLDYGGETLLGARRHFAVAE